LEKFDLKPLVPGLDMIPSAGVAGPNLGKSSWPLSCLLVFLPEESSYHRFQKSTVSQIPLYSHRAN
jgi:hypothetical protein